MIKQTSITILLSISLISACTESVKPNNTVKQSNPIDKLENFVPTKLQIASGLLEGIAALPYLLNTPITTINKALIEATALPKKYLQIQKAQAILITLAANSILNEKTMPEYKEIETRWLKEKAAREIVEQRFEDINRKMGV